MPLPKPSKMISKRYKKSKALNPFIKPPAPAPPSPSTPSFSHPKLWPPTPLRKWRVRVICTDPDATDDSSADELDSPASPCKRSVHEILLPIPPSLSQPSTPESSPPQPCQKRQSPNPCNSIARSKKKKLRCDFRGSEAILQDMGDLLNSASETCTGNVWRPGSMPNRSMILSDSKCAPAEEEFTQFLADFLMDIGDRSLWDNRIGGSAMSQEDEIADMLNLELDSEALTWINSLQRLP